MTFSDAWVMWIGVPLVLAMVIWHVLRTQATRHVVPSLQLWQQVLYEQASRRPVTWPTPWWLVLLRVSICSVLVVAAAGPVWVHAETQPTRLIAIDTSVSMQTRTPAGVRIDIAKQYANTLITDAPAATRFTIVALSNTARVLVSQVQDRSMALQAITQVQAEPIAIDVQHMIPVINQLASQRSTVYLMSDDIAMWHADGWPPPWQRIPIGGNAPNMAIQEMALQATSTGWQGQVRITADGTPWPTPRLLELRDAAGTLYDATYVWSKDDGTIDWTFQLVNPPDVLVATLQPDAHDALAADDAYWWRKPNVQHIHVYLQSADQHFLPAALQILPNVVRVRQLAQADVAIVDAPQTLPTVITVPTWLINPPIPATASFPVLQPNVLHGEAALLDQDIDLQQTQIMTASVLKMPLWAQQWLHSSAGTHAYAGINQGVPQVVLGVALAQSDLPLRGDFPLLVRNILRFLMPQTPVESLQTGQILTLAGNADRTPPVLVTQPPQANARLQFQQGVWHLIDIKTIGAYQVDQQWYVANLLAPWESATQRPDTLSLWQSWQLRLAVSLRQLGMWGALVLLVLERILTWYTKRTT